MHRNFCGVKFSGSVIFEGSNFQAGSSWLYRTIVFIISVSMTSDKIAMHSFS